MAILYVDPVGGNDSNNGTTFALRKRTLSSASTASAAGDTIRVMQSPDPTLVGNATWTHDSKTVTLAAPVTANIDTCDAGWSANSNVTVTLVNNATAKEGTNCTQFAIGTATTGNMMYKALSNADFSAYHQVSFWLRQTTGTLAQVGDLSFRFAADAVASSSIATLSMLTHNIGALNQWMCFTIVSTNPLPSGVNSIAIVRNVNRGAQTFQIDNILACKAAAAPDSLSLTSLISKNNGEAWYPIRSINGTTIVLNQGANVSAADNTMAYHGTTETVPLYKRETTRLGGMAASGTGAVDGFAALNNAGTVNNRKVYSGGWNSTDMSTKVGETYIDGINGHGWLFSMGGAYQTIEDINATRVNVAFVATGVGSTVSAQSITGNTTAAIYLSNVTDGQFTFQNVCANGALSTVSAIYYNAGAQMNNTITVTNLCSNYGTGLSTGLANVTNGASGSNYRETYNITTLGNNGSHGVQVTSVVDSTLNITRAYGTYPIVIGSISGSSYSLIGQSPYNCTIKVTESVQGDTTDAIRVFTANDTVLDLRGATVTSPQAGILLSHNADVRVLGGTVQRVRYDITDSLFIGTTFTGYDPAPTDMNAVSARVTVQDYGGVKGDNRIYSPSGTISTTTAQRHSTTGRAWNLNNLNPSTGATIPAGGYYQELPLATVAVGAGTQVTATVWVRQDLSTARTRFVLKGGQIDGVPTDIVVPITPGSFNQWEQLTITFTPTSAGVVTFHGQFSATLSTNTNAWFDDFDVSQA